MPQSVRRHRSRLFSSPWHSIWSSQIGPLPSPYSAQHLGMPFLQSSTQCEPIKQLKYFKTLQKASIIITTVLTRIRAACRRRQLPHGQTNCHRRCPTDPRARFQLYPLYRRYRCSSSGEFQRDPGPRPHCL